MFQPEPGPDLPAARRDSATEADSDLEFPRDKVTLTVSQYW
jgi:hypothetical protein